MTLGMGMTYGKLLFCHGISEESKHKKIITREYNGSKFYDFFNNPFPYDCVIPYLNIPPITIVDSPQPDKRA